MIDLFFLLVLFGVECFRMDLVGLDAEADDFRSLPAASGVSTFRRRMFLAVLSLQQKQKGSNKSLVGSINKYFYLSIFSITVSPLLQELMEVVELCLL